VNQGKVLVIEPDLRQADVWSTVLGFLGYEPISFGDIDRVEWPAPTAMDWTAIILGPVDSQASLRRFFQHLCAYHSMVPVICVTNETHSIPESAFPPDWPRLGIDLPVRHAPLAAVLEQAEHVGKPATITLSNRPAGRSKAILEVHALMELVAPHDTHVLVLGESGTGKEMVARHIHETSLRSAGPFVPVNCGAIPGELLESELFGHERGAFTGALAARQGRFEFANGGTLFLDEIGDMSLPMQVKILRVLQERTIERVGSNRSMRCDVRIVAATHRDLEAGIRDGWFREDLFYRLNVFPIQMPPLRDRVDDLPFLVEQVNLRLRHAGRETVDLTPAAFAALGSYGWPGNVRELSNVMERLSILHKGRCVDVGDLPERYRGNPRPQRSPNEAVSPIAGQAPRRRSTDLPAVDTRVVRAAAAAPPGAQAAEFMSHAVDLAWPENGLDLNDHLSSIEASLIRRALAQSHGTVAEAARLLGIGRTTLVEKLRKHRLADTSAA